jgi:Zn-finger nucleic acid-binding protein
MKKIIFTSQATGNEMTGEVIREERASRTIVNIKIEYGCNELWLDRDELDALLKYLSKAREMLIR